MIRWKVTLSNGDSYLEGNFPYEVLAGKKTPWLRLQEYLKNNGVKIESLQLQDGNRYYSLSGDVNEPDFKWVRESPKPISFDFYRAFHSDNGKQDKYDRFVIAEANYGDHILQIWVNEDTKQCFSIIK